MVTGNRSGDDTVTLGDILRSRRLSRFVGRAAEIEFFRLALQDSGNSFSVLFIHGPGGIGKSSLLDVLATEALDAGAAVVRIDAGDLASSALFDAILADLPEDSGRIVVMLDAYERIASLEERIRTDLVPSLPATALTVIAGRKPPSAAWRADPAWGDLLRVVSLRNLRPDESRRLLDQCGVPNEAHDRLLSVSHGHPLGLALLADVVLRGGEAAVGHDAAALPPQLVGELVRQFVDVVPSGAQRRALEVCALARVTTEALLRDVVGADAAHELFDWLRELSFVEAGPEGLRPHDLARDVLDVDLRWRDVEGYKQTFRAVRTHIHRRLAETRGRQQQQAIFDEKYVFRNLPSILSPVDWTSWGFSYPEQAERDDHEWILDLVQRWEGAASKKIAEMWLAVQPEAFFVLRDDDGAPRGFLGLIDLTRASAEQRAGDPGAEAAWSFALRESPPRAREIILQARYVIDRDAYQGQSPTMNAGPILTIQRYLNTPHLAWGFLTLAEPERWDAYFAVADLPRAREADFTVGGRRFGLFTHDFRAVPVDVWLELVTERALEQDFTLPPSGPAEALALSEDDFADAVRQALRDLRRSDLLGRNPLLRSRMLRERAADPDAVDLETLLSDAIDTLREDPRDDRLFRAVERTYVHATPTQEVAAEALGVPFSTYRRHLTKGVERVVAWLWDREVYGPSR